MPHILKIYLVVMWFPRCTMIEIREGRGLGPRGDYVLLKLNHLDPEIFKTRLPGITELAKTFAGVDPTKEPVPVAPTCHYMMGGIPTNIHAQALTIDSQGNDQIIPGLYAAGECACVSVHGANRLGANSLLDIVVFGRAAGLHLEETLQEGIPLPEVSREDIEVALSRLVRWDNSTQGESVALIRSDMQKVMQQDFGVFREGKAMQEGLQKLLAIRERLQHAVLTDKTQVFNTARIEALELENMMEVAIASAICADARKESRGAHSRLDYPDRDDQNWLKHSLYFRDKDLSSRSVNFKPKEAQAVKLQKRIE